MAITTSEKNLLLDKLAIACNRATHLHALCSRLGKVEQAAAAARRRERLRLEMDILIRDYYGQWQGEAKELRQTLDAANKTLDGYLHDIERMVQVSENLAKAAVVLDGTIALAARLAG